VNPIEHPVIFSAPRRLARVSAWREHIPLGMFLVSAARPRTVVELGTHWGNSYCAFCQAVDELQLGAQCYAVDTWAGDPHAGSYDSAVLADLRAHHDPLYARFSTLIQSTFDDARDHFADASIDLLHIDGYHTYEAARHDVDTWLPKLSERGLLLLHDVNARRRGFGVWRLWEELKSEHRHVELHHAAGLGLLAVGPDVPREIDELLDAGPESLDTFRAMFFHLGHRLRLQLQLEERRVGASAS
jgi:hypothetical protein